MRRPDRAIKETRKGGKSMCPEQGQLCGEGSWGKPLKNIHTAPRSTGRSVRPPWTCFQAGAGAQPPKKAAGKCS